MFVGHDIEIGWISCGSLHALRARKQPCLWASFGISSKRRSPHVALLFSPPLLAINITFLCFYILQYRLVKVFGSLQAATQDENDLRAPITFFPALFFYRSSLRVLVERGEGSVYIAFGAHVQSEGFLFQDLS